MFLHMIGMLLLYYDYYDYTIYSIEACTIN